MTYSTEMQSKIENLLLGEGRDDFRLVETRTRHFCPFEAVGMVRQEIRHSSFLAYMLDPARPHGLSDTLLRALVFLLLDKAECAGCGKLDIHFRPMTAARVFRERQNIDVLIEIPSENGNRGIVIALELKIDAGERSNQLQDYQQRIMAGYGAEKWIQLFGFITKEGADASSAGETHGWVSLSWAKLISAFENAILRESAQGRGVELFQDYAKMMKRHNMADGDPDPHLSKAVRNIWAQHKEALEYLIDNRPDALGDLQRNLSDDIIMQALRVRDIRVGVVHCEKRIRRFCFPDLITQFKRAQTGNWIKGSNSVFCLEIHFHTDSIYAAIVIGPSEDNEFRTALIDRMRADPANGAVRDNKWTHMFPEAIIEDEDDAIAISDGHSLQEAALAVAERIAGYVKDIHPKIERALEEASR